MMCLSQTTGHAIQALSCLNESACECRLIADIARCSSVPKAYLAKIFNLLARRRLVTAKRGYCSTWNDAPNLRIVPRPATKRAHAFDKAAEKSGVRIDGQYWTLGAFDGVLILSADKPEKALQCLTELAAGGYVKTETLPAFTDKEFDAIANR